MLDDANITMGFKMAEVSYQSNKLYISLQLLNEHLIIHVVLMILCPVL